jgi:protein tyrosine phosphatase
VEILVDVMQKQNYHSEKWQQYWRVDESVNVLKHHSGIELHFSRMQFGLGRSSFLSVKKPNNLLLRINELAILKQQAHKFLSDYPETKAEKNPISKLHAFTQQDFSHPAPLLIAMSKDITEMNQTLWMQQQGLKEYAIHNLQRTSKNIGFAKTIFKEFYLPRLEFYQTQKDLWLKEANSTDSRAQTSLNNFQQWIESLRTNIEIMITSLQKDEAIHQGKTIH